MQFLIAQGSSIRKIFVKCWCCEKEFVWLRLYRSGSRVGAYIAVCSKCIKESEKVKWSESADNYIIKNTKVNKDEIITRSKRVNKNHIKILNLLKEAR